jgi:frataxin-like iron-binding protein CyaY
MRKFLVKINAYQYHAEFEVLAEDNVKSIENAIVDKLGEKSINWEYLGEMMDPKIKRITYEEVINDTRPVQTEKVLGVEVATGV